MSLQATDIRVSHGRTDVLHGVDFTAYPGQLTAIVGPNGSGKTTLLRALTGDSAYRGQVCLNGQRVDGLRPWELARARGVLPQATPLAFPFTVFEVVRLGLLSGIDAGDTTLPERALEAVGLAGFAGRFYQELSGGEQQRVQLARVLCQVWHPVEDGTPRWLFLDEPVASLDIGHQLMIMQLARGYADRGGGVIAVMHDLNLTAMFADRVSMLQAGTVAAEGTPGQVLTDRILSQVYGCQLRVNACPPPGGTFLLPHSASL